MKRIFLILVTGVSLYADILFNGQCGSYHYNLNISSNVYYGAFCHNDSLFVYEDKRTDNIRAIYTDPTDLSFDIYDFSDGRVKKTFQFNEGDIVFVGDSTYIYRLLALITGFTVLFGSIILLGGM